MNKKLIVITGIICIIATAVLWFLKYWKFDKEISFTVIFLPLVFWVIGVVLYFFIHILMEGNGDDDE